MFIHLRNVQWIGFVLSTTPTANLTQRFKRQPYMATAAHKFMDIGCFHSDVALVDKSYLDATRQSWVVLEALEEIYVALSVASTTL